MRKLNTLPSANMRKLPNCTRLPRPLELQHKAPVEVLPELQHKAPVEVLPELPQEPEVGKLYMYKGSKVECIARGGCRDCIRPCATMDGIICSLASRVDGKSVQFVPVY